MPRRYTHRVTFSMTSMTLVLNPELVIIQKCRKEGINTGRHNRKPSTMNEVVNDYKLRTDIKDTWVLTVTWTWKENSVCDKKNPMNDEKYQNGRHKRHYIESKVALGRTNYNSGKCKKNWKERKESMVAQC